MTLAYIVRSSIETSAVVGVGGCVFYFLKGACWRNKASGGGDNDLVAGAKEVMDKEARIRRCAAWSGVVSAIDLGMQHVRSAPDDPLNLMVAWGAANAVFSVHRGPGAAVREGLKGAALGGAVGAVLIIAVRLALLASTVAS
uniref:Uncharacterized protein n=1 Tax=Avena sativa TaxID=4498 RepID=A0ACD5TCX9_AVESA